MKILPLFKTHFSIGKSILTTEEALDKNKKPVYNSVYHLLKSNNLDNLVLVEDSISGLLEASKTAKENKIKLVFGLRIWITEDCLDKKEENLRKRAKYIIFAKNSLAYKDLIKISSYASNEGFYYEPCIDFKTLKSIWNNNLKLAIPFYDSFLFLNSLENHTHVPQLDFTKPTLFLEDNDLPFDDCVKERVLKYSKDENLDIISAQSIYYPSENDFLAYMTVRCLHNRTTLDKPNLDSMSSSDFNFKKWLINNK